MESHRSLYIDIPINRAALKSVRTHMDAAVCNETRRFTRTILHQIIHERNELLP